MLVDTTPWIAPVVEDLSAKEMTPYAPHGFVFFRVQMVMTEHQVIEVLHLERYMIETIFGSVTAEEHVVIDVGIAAIAAIE